MWLLSFGERFNTMSTFTLEQILAAHAQVKTGADFPRYAKALQEMGVSHYEFRLRDGGTVYYGIEGQKVVRPGVRKLEVADEGNADLLIARVKIHQAGGSDFPTLCGEAAAAGVDRWVTDLEGKEVRYYDVRGNVLLQEGIPGL